MSVPGERVVHAEGTGWHVPTRFKEQKEAGVAVAE